MKRNRVLLAALAMGGLVSAANAAVVTMTAGDASGTSSYNTVGHWDSGATPTAGNTYVVNIATANTWLRSPAATGSYTFGGDSLTLRNRSNNTGWLFKSTGGTNVSTFTQNLILDGGLVRSGQGYAETNHLAGTISVIGSSTSEIRGDQGIFAIDAPISGTGPLLLNIGGGGGANITINGVNTYTGNLTIADTLAAGITFSSTSSYLFDIGASGASNQILASGTYNGTTTFDGAFAMDLADATMNAGDSWQLVAAGLPTTYGTNFSVTGFAHSGATTWTSSNGVYQFDTSTGALTVVPEPASLGVLALGGLALLRRRR
jgi:hypothetical protein